jgi:zinc protease
MKKKSLFLLLFLALLCPSYLFSGEQIPSVSDPCVSQSWPQEVSDVKPDPRLVFGRLNNGFRYVLVHNTEPRDRVAMYLDVRTGSLNETDSQRGLAHFLEHMVFNGSTHFKPGELIEYFQSLGMSFGGDTNAHTGFQETVYDILLPKGTNRDIEKGLTVFSDYARGALLLDSEIDRERGVIFSEMRARDSAAYRNMTASAGFAYQGTRFPERFPIGVSEVLNKADHVRLKEYYDAWYRPENMILVMVGDFTPEEIKPLIEKQFSQLQEGGPPPQCPDFGQISHKGLEFFYHFEPELGLSRVGIETVWDEAPHKDSFDLQVRNLKKDLAVAMITHRLEKLGEDPNTPFSKSSYSEDTLLDRIGYGAISVTTDPEKWEAALRVVDRTLRQALQYGFSEAEFQRVQKEALAELDHAVQTAPTRSSMSLAGDIITSLNADRVPQSPAQQKELFQPVIEKMRLQEVQESFAAVWAHPVRLVLVTGNTRINSPESRIRAVYEQAQKEQIAPYAAQEDVRFPYLPLPATPAAPLTTKPLPGIDAERLVFANGLVLNLKKTDYKKNGIAVRVDFGQGKQTEPAPGLGMLAETVVNGSGTGRLTGSDLDRVLAGSTVALSFHVNDSSFSWEGGAAPGDLERLFQVLQTLLLDPGIRDDAYAVAKENFKQMYSKMDSDIKGGLDLEVKRFLAGGYPHAGMPTWENFSRLQPAQIRDWLLPAISGSPLEISLVGDFDRNQAVALIGRYFGGLAARKPLPAAKKVKLSFPRGQQRLTTVDSSVAKAGLLVAWPTADFWDISRTRRLNVLASVFEDRLRKKVREELGETYSPTVFNISSRVYPGYGLMQALIIVEPEAVGRIRDVVLGIGEDLRKNGCTDDELARAKAPILTSLKDVVRTNNYWLNTVLSLSDRYPQQLLWPQSLREDFQAITAKDIELLARKYLAADNAAVAVVTPGKEKKSEQSPLSPHNP